MKKITAALAVCMLALCGCGSIDNSSDTAETTASKAAAATSSSSAEGSAESTEANGAAEEDLSELDAFIDAYTEKCKKNDDPEAICSDVYPNLFIEKLKNAGQWNDFVKAYHSALDGYKIDVKNLKRNKKLSSSELRSAEKTYKNMFGSDVVITKGYDYTMTTVAEYGGQVQEIPSEMWALYLSGEGWKVLNKKSG